MLTIITEVELREGADRQWDTVMGARMNEAKKRPGWVGGQLLSSDEAPKLRVIVGTWKTRADWKQWHQDPLFTETRRQLDTLVDGPERHRWHDVLLDVRKGREKRVKTAR